MFCLLKKKDSIRDNHLGLLLKVTIFTPKVDI